MSRNTLDSELLLTKKVQTQSTRRITLVALAVAAAATAGTAGYLGLLRPRNTAVHSAPVATVEIPPGNCDALNVQGPEDHREVWERERDAYLAGCPNPRVEIAADAR